MKTIKTSIAILAVLIFTISCSKDDPASAPVKLPSAEVSFENTTSTPILDNTSIISNINVTANGTILDLKKMILEMNIEHTYQSDLSFSLISPDGTESLFIDRIGYYGDYIFTNKLRFSAAFTNRITNESIDVPAGEYKESKGVFGGPALLPIFSAFQAKSMTGTWKLKVTDHEASNSGTIISWKLIFQAGALNQ